MAKTHPQVMLLGKGKSKNLKETHDLIKKIHPKNVPAELLEGMYVTLESDQKFQIDPKLLKDGVNYEEMEPFLRHLGFKEDIQLIEIVVDLDKTKKKLNKATSALLDNLFDS